MSVGRGQAVHQGIHDHLLENSFKPLMGKLTAAHQDGQMDRRVVVNIIVDQ